MNSLSVTQSQITQIAQQVSSVCWAMGIPYTMLQLEDCALALLKLTQVAPSEEQAMALFAQLVTDTGERGESWAWLTLELYFEVNVLLQGDRPKAALLALQGEPSLSDVALDRYHDRLRRVKTTG